MVVMMNTSFRFVALPYEPFAPLFDLSDEDLASAGIHRLVVDEAPGTPCRVSLVDAAVGETVLLLPFTHHDAPTPYRASGAIFVREGARRAEPAVNEIPAMFRHRCLSVRAYDTGGMMVDSAVADGSDLDTAVRDLYARDEVAYLHVHNAGPGCFGCVVERA